MTKSAKKILLVDDEERLLDSISKRLSLLGFEPLKAVSGSQAIDIAKNKDIDLAIVDLKMPDMDGLVTITKLKEIIPDIKTVLLTGYGNEKVKEATEALGSVYIEKDSMGGLWDIIKQSGNDGKVVVIKPTSKNKIDKTGRDMSSQVEIIDEQTYNEFNRLPSDPVLGYHSPASMVLPKIMGETHEMQRLKKNIKRFSEMDCAIIIRGEIGTGKELAARTIHSLSHRKDQKFLAFDCGCFSTDFHFSELVASFDKIPQYKQSENRYDSKRSTTFSGTILLDHIENMPGLVQEEMINLLDGKTVSGDQLMDIRFIVVAHRNLKEKVAKGTFQKELYRRIRAIEMEIPPLRQRKEDLSILCHYFLNQYNQEFGKKIKTISNEVLKIFRSYSFPGNVRELKSIIERAVILTDKDRITTAQLPEKLKNGFKETLPKDRLPFPTIQQMEQDHILKAIQMTKGNKSKAAELLGISRAALWRKLRIMSENDSGKTES